MAYVRIDPNTGDRRLVLTDDDVVEKANKNAKPVTLWDIVHGSYTVETVDGKAVPIRMLPITIGTLAKIEELDRIRVDKQLSSMAYSIAFLTVVVNDPRARGDRPPMTEEEVGNAITSDMYQTMMQLVTDHLSPLAAAGTPDPAEIVKTGPSAGTGSSIS